MKEFTPFTARKGSSLLFAKRINSFLLPCECNVSVGLSFQTISVSLSLSYAIFADPGFNITYYGARRHGMEMPHWMISYRSASLYSHNK